MVTHPPPPNPKPAPCVEYVMRLLDTLVTIEYRWTKCETGARSNAPHHVRMTDHIHSHFQRMIGKRETVRLIDGNKYRLEIVKP